MALQDEAELEELVTPSISPDLQQTFLIEKASSNDQRQILKFHHVIQDRFATDTTPGSETMSLRRPTLKGVDPSSLEFQFVNISEPAEIKNSKNKKLVRRSVAFSHRRKQVLRHSTDHGSTSSPHSCLDPNLNSQPPVNYCQVCGFSLQKKRGGRSVKSDEGEIDSTEKECLETGWLGAGRTGPFSTFPIASQPYMHLLVDYCKFRNSSIDMPHSVRFNTPNSFQNSTEF